MAENHYTPKPCKKCGSIERHKSGPCISCHRETVKRWRKNNPDKVKKSNEKWKKNNPDVVNEHGRKWKKNNPDKVREIKQKRRAIKAGSSGKFTASEFKTLCSHYDYRCLKCGKKKHKLSADHVIPLSRGGTNTIDNIQPLCGPCNSSKRDKIKDYRTKPLMKRWTQKKLL